MQILGSVFAYIGNQLRSHARLEAEAKVIGQRLVLINLRDFKTSDSCGLRPGIGEEDERLLRLRLRLHRPSALRGIYYGKGRGPRKDAHLFEDSDSAKSQRIQEIKKQDLTPIIRIIARGLTETEALLIEKTLLWTLGKLMTNVDTGHFAAKFRPPNTLHRELSGFDFQNGIFYYNVGECEFRNWDDYVKFGFISAGQGKRWRDAMLGFNL